MSRKGNSLKHELFVAAIKDIKNNQSKVNYKRSIRRFSQWAKTQGIKHKDDITEEVIQSYQSYLKADPKDYTPATIHTYLAPVCKAVNINLNRIRKDKRKSDKIIRGRKSESNAQGKKQEKDARFSRLVNFQKVVGIRRNELRKLKGGDLKRDASGNYFVIVRRGKGGKRQEQYILPKDIELGKKTFKDIGEEEAVFSDNELNNQINLHKMRAQHARDSYFYYLDLIQKNSHFKDSLRKHLIKTWEDGHQRLKSESERQYYKQRNIFIYHLREELYCLRGTNRQKAILSGMPQTYNRLALMAVSVLNLSHWRLSVAVTNYLL